jgi:hypothetical protein
MIFQVISIVIILIIYFYLCYKRWTYARHFGQSFKLMTYVDFLEGWRLMTMEPYYFQQRVFMILILLMCLFLFIFGFIA